MIPSKVLPRNTPEPNSDSNFLNENLMILTVWLYKLESEYKIQGLHASIENSNEANVARITLYLLFNIQRSLL